MMDEIKANPGKYSVSSTPSGSLWSNVAVYARDKLGLDIKIVNYKGGGPSVRALLSGEVDIGCMGVTPQVSHIKVGKLRPLAATVPEDWETGGFVYPTITRWVDDPLMAKTLPWTNMNGIALKKGTPEDILKKIDAAFSEAMANPKMQEVYKSNGFFAYQKGRDQGANDLMKSRTEFQAFVVEVILNKAKVTRESLGIEKLEDKL
jgi:tripartite-type tricarboxylate transporter receptor subunit TctC